MFLCSLVSLQNNKLSILLDINLSYNILFVNVLKLGSQYPIHPCISIGYDFNLLARRIVLNTPKTFLGKYFIIFVFI